MATTQTNPLEQVLGEILENAARFTSGQLSREEWMNLEGQFRSGIAGSVIAKVCFEDPGACYDMLIALTAKKGNGN